ncbi:MAG: hypothetical protein A2033_06625 [Bacteroidetes bacterium GWA2_31_9]|nr:MAG: hypothetical protein A2033_06625 [Bacteroidetes bacterium GWA2_31_9]
MKSFNEQRFKVLIVDDNPKNIQVIGNILQVKNYIIGYATDGKQALNLLQKSPDYDIVLLDVNMPVMNGFEVCIEIRKDELLKNIPIIFITALTEVENVIKGFNIGAQDYITKPFKAKELIVRVNTHLMLKYKSDQIQSYAKELEIKNAEIELQHEIVTKQKNQIEYFYSEITESIKYAQRIQNAVLPTKKYIDSLLDSYFIIFKPKNTVSGDFYWISKRDNWILAAVADCTGHGVPGAIMSMLGISFINEIIARDSIRIASDVLNELRSSVINALQQKGISGEQKDGMDIAFIALDTETYTLQYSGANIPLYYISENSNDLVEVKPDNMPISIYVKMNPFTNNIIPITKGFKIYLTTDGYADQFGGPDGKKFLSRQLKRLIEKNHTKLFPDQKDMYEYKLDDWMNSYEKTYEQTDDIAFVGIQF